MASSRPSGSSRSSDDSARRIIPFPLSFDERRLGITSASLTFPKPPPDPNQDNKEEEQIDIDEILRDLENLTSEEEYEEDDEIFTDEEFDFNAPGPSTSNMQFFAKAATAEVQQSEAAPDYSADVPKE